MASRCQDRPSIEPLTLVVRIAAVGIGATLLMDLRLLALKRAGVPTLDVALLGRWTGHPQYDLWMIPSSPARPVDVRNAPR